MSEGVTAGGSSRVLNLERENCEHLRWTHFKQVQRCPAKSHFQCTQSQERWRIRINVAVYQEKKNKEGNRREKTGNQFLKNCVLPFWARSGGSIAKNELGVPRVTGPSGSSTAISTQPKLGWRPYHHARAAVD